MWYAFNNEMVKESIPVAADYLQESKSPCWILKTSCLSQPADRVHPEISTSSTEHKMFTDIQKHKWFGEKEGGITKSVPSKASVGGVIIRLTRNGTDTDLICKMVIY